MSLDKFGYTPTANRGVRRMALMRAIQKNGYLRVYEELIEDAKLFDGYKKARARSDKNWLKKRIMKFERFF